MPTALLAALLLAAATARPPPLAIVATAPGYPGTSAEAQPHMDAFAAAVARLAGWREGAAGAVYEPTEEEGLARLAPPDAAVALVPLPFLQKHGKALRLRPRLLVAQQGTGPTETWTLVARKGRVASPAALAGFTVASIAGYAPDFVRGALGPWGRIPASAKVVSSGQVLSWLRRAAAGEDVAVLLDGSESAALASLPFAGDLETVARSAALPAAYVATVGTRLPAARWRALEKALLALRSDPAGSAALEGIRMTGFAPLDAAAEAAARQVAGASR